MSKRAKVSGGLLEFIPPQLPTRVQQPPQDKGWVHEVDLDGYRTQVIVDKGGVRLYSQNGRDWTVKYWPLALAVDLPCQAAIIDGEVIVPGEQGGADCPALEAAIWNQPNRLVFVSSLLQRLEAIPGISSVTVSNHIPPELDWRDIRSEKDTGSHSATAVVVPGYFKAIGATILRGRDFDLADVTPLRPVAIINA